MIKTARQLKDLIRNLSKTKSADAQVLMRNYMMERFLERISLSDYRDKFILKGGMLVAAMVGLDARSTMDMDATVKGTTVGIEEVENMIPEHNFCVLRGLGRSLNKHETVGFRMSGNWQFSQSGSRFALLAAFLLPVLCPPIW